MDDRPEEDSPADAAPEADASAADTDPGGGRPSALDAVTQPTLAKVEPAARYHLGEELGAGGMGKVFRAHDPRLQRAVALKLLRFADPSLEERFFREARSQARVDHPNVCKVYEVGYQGDAPFIAMQLVEGPTLRGARSALTVEEKVRVVRDVALGVHAAHLQGLIHRDLKPANILLGRDGDGRPHPFVTDFGLARDLESPGNTLAGAVLGTPQYMAPEQGRGEHERLDARTDVYALGAVLYELLGGSPPHGGASNLQVLYQLASQEPAELRARAPEVPAPLSAVVMRCLEKRPERRYPSAKALADDLTAFLAGEPVTARVPSALERARRRLRKTPALAALLGAALAAAALALLALRPPPKPLQRPLVAVADFDDQTGDGLSGLSGMLITALEQSRHVQVLTRSRLLDLLRARGRAEVQRLDEPLAREAAVAGGATALALGTLRRFDQVYALDLQLVDPRTGDSLGSARAEATGRGALPGLVDRVASEARAALRERAEELRSQPVSAMTTGNLEAWQRYFRGEALVDRLRFREAQAEFEAALALDPGFALAWYRLGYAQMWMHDAPRAAASIEKAWALADRVPEKERLQIAGVRAVFQENGAEAWAAWSACLQRYPQEKECAFNVGDLLFHSGEIEKSVPAFQQALALDPAHERALSHLAWAFQLLDRHAELLQVAAQYQERIGTADAWGHLGRAQASAGDFAGAARTFHRAAELFPQSPQPPADLATLAAFTGDLEGAAEAARPLLAPGRPAHDRWLGHQTLGWIALLGGRVRAAAEHQEGAARAAAEAQAGEQESAALASRGLTEVLFRGDPAAALALARDATARSLPETPFAYVYPFAGALDDYGRVLHHLGDPFASQEVAAFSARARGEPQAAEGAFAALVLRSPYRDFLLYPLAQAQADQGRAAAAAATLRRAQARYPELTAPGFGFPAVFRARGDLLLSALLEQSGDARGAVESAQRFARMWAGADPERGEVTEAQSRVARLGGAGVRR